MNTYLDTNVVVWLAQGTIGRISQAAVDHLDSADLLISPMVLLELEYLYEGKKTLLSSSDILLKIERELGVRVCRLDFPLIVNVGLNEKWTRDPFDRIIVAHAKANGLSYLVSANKEIMEKYPRTIW